MELDFDPRFFDPRKTAVEPPLPGGTARRDGKVYVYEPHVVLAVNAAIASERPLFVEGPVGCGKSTLAAHVARVLGWRYYSTTITSRAQAQDLLWRFDALARLRDAQATALKPDAAYVDPGPLWWAFDRASARSRGGDGGNALVPAVDPSKVDSPHAVVLVDELDKADPDVPNDLLRPLGEDSFDVTELRLEVRRDPSAQILVVVTSNRERDMPPAFLRRCVHLRLRHHSKENLLQIARQHFGSTDSAEELFSQIAQAVIRGREEAKTAGVREPSTAEFLDAIAVCRKMGLTAAASAWRELSQLALNKTIREAR